ncbi:MULTISPECIES: DUF488 domain-containing protein [Legionella]|uniref:DUF488 domain-containing protein n=1 Tax=Legionella TaxID=445 RepID=UPI00095B29A7|nr:MULTISPECIES: DUF488 domain-containing protein [Legionella]MBN9225972.1 DUF488 domain-containing protein [Legionella steelei]OJW07939.1 MAG: hypothetical protein BGO44_15010 [Legionella sp. 39-23]
MSPIKIKRIYEQPGSSDGYRILVDRLWPRGVKKEKADIDLWLKDVAPSNGLRHWFNHEPEKWPEFQERYAQELKNKEEQVQTIITKAKSQTVTLLYGAKDEQHNNALALLELIKSIKK